MVRAPLREREEAEAEVGAAKTRLWLLYLAGVSLGFERGTIGIFQTLASQAGAGERAGCRRRGRTFTTILGDRAR
jgi:hypothetical protein